MEQQTDQNNPLPMDFEGIEVDGLSFVGMDYSRSVLRQSKHGNCDYTNCSFEGSDLSNAVYRRCVFRGCDFDTAVMQKTQFISCMFDNCSIKNAHLGYAVFKSTSFSGSALTGTNLDRSYIFNTAIAWCQFDNVSARWTRWEHCCVEESHFSGEATTFEGAMILDSGFTDVSFAGADMADADPRTSKFEGCDFSEALLKGTFIKGVEFTNNNWACATLGATIPPLPFVETIHSALAAKSSVHRDRTVPENILSLANVVDSGHVDDLPLMIYVNSDIYGILDDTRELPSTDEDVLSHLVACAQIERLRIAAKAMDKVRGAFENVALALGNSLSPLLEQRIFNQCDRIDINIEDWNFDDN